VLFRSIRPWDRPAATVAPRRQHPMKLVQLSLDGDIHIQPKHTGRTLGLTRFAGQSDYAA